MSKQVLRLLTAAMMLLCSTAFVNAQGVTTGAITGVVTDQNGAPVVDAEVVVRNVRTGYTSRGLTRSNGLFLIQGLEVGGPYDVMVSRLGYASAEQPGIYVRLSQATRVDVQLATQAVRLDELAVTTARTADFSPTRQGITVQISDTLVARIPTFSRDFVDLIKLAPQVVYPASGAASGGGAYNRFNTITIDGTNQSERFNLASSNGVPGGASGSKIVSLDAVKEFRVMFTPADVRQGNFSGMLVNAVTKNGENQFSGGGSFTYRTNSDFAGLEMVAEELRQSEFSVKQYAFHLGGPIIRDRLHFFIAPEFQQRTRPAAGPYYLNGEPSTETAPSVELDSLALIASIMQNNYDFDVGETGPVDNENPLTNLFGRLDFQISPEHRLVLRQIINRAEDGSFLRNIATLNTSPLNQNTGFRLGSNRFDRVSKNNSTVAQLYSNLSNGMSNELLIGYSSIVDERKVPVQAPEVAVGVNMGGTIRAVTFGTEQFSPNNLLEQDIFEIVNNFTMPFGNHTVTVGGRFDHTNIFNNFAQGTFGVYTFSTIADLQAGTPLGYAVGYANSRDPADIPADFGVQMFSLYGQDQWTVNDRLTLTGGLRIDIPRLLDAPPNNVALSEQLSAAGLERRTDEVPGTSVLFSPRLGFNYDPKGDLNTQVRGSLGIYTGPPPYILLGNAYSNTGLGLVRLACGPVTGTTAPAFTMNVDSLPTSCAGDPEPAPGEASTVGINTIDPDFKYPQYFGASLGFDYRLPYNTVLTVEGMYRKAINGVMIRDANISGPNMNGDVPVMDRDGRVMYADAISTTGSVTNPGQRYLGSLTEGVIEVTNQSKDHNYSISTQLNRRFSDRLEATVAYTYMKSEDVQSLTSDRAISNWRNGRQLSNAHEDLVTAPSVFSRPHRILAYGTYTMPWELTSVTLYYEGSSGSPFSYVAADDLNGDGYNGNDLIYIPNDATDPNEIQIGTGIDGAFTQNADAAEAFERFIESQECMDEQRGSIMKRNSCRSPFQHRFDLSIRQAVPQIRGQQVSLQLDVFNLFNAFGALFDRDEWGIVKLPTLSPAFPDQRALDATGRNSGPLDQSIPTFTFDNRLYDSDPTSDTYLSPRPFEGRLGNVYQIQLTLRYAF